jgi:hypothetical protein
MAFTRDDVKALNHDIRTLRLQNGLLSELPILLMNPNVTTIVVH